MTPPAFSSSRVGQSLAKWETKHTRGHERRDSTNDEKYYCHPQEYCLPTIPGDHPDLKSISCETMAALLRGEYDDIVEKFIVVDSRYPYEYEGGHIQGKVPRSCFLKEFCLNELHLIRHSTFEMNWAQSGYTCTSDLIGTYFCLVLSIAKTQGHTYKRLSLPFYSRKIAERNTSFMANSMCARINFWRYIDIFTRD